MVITKGARPWTSITIDAEGSCCGRKRLGHSVFVLGLTNVSNGETAVFAWAPQSKNWLKDPDYVFWLGTVKF